MTTRLIHRPARTERPAAAPPARTIEAPPNLPEGKTGSGAMALLPMAGVMSSVVMMTVVRNSQFAAIGAVVLVVAVIGGVGMLLSQRGKAQRTRRQQRERYLEYLEELREELAAEERELRETARVLNPPPAALYDIVRDPSRLWERRRLDADFLKVRVGSGEMPLRPLTVGQQSGSVLTPPDRFMLNEAGALISRFGTTGDLPLTVPLDRAGNASVIGDREGVLRVARALLVQTAATHAPDDVHIALGCPGDRMADWEWLKWLPHLLDGDERDGPVSARRIAPDVHQLARLLGRDLRQRASYAAELRRGLSNREALAMAGRLLVVSDEYGATAQDLPRPDEAVPLRDMGVTVLHLLSERVQEPGQVSLRITVDGDRVTVEDLRGEQPLVAHGTVDDVTTAGAEGLARMLAPLRLSAESLVDAPLSGPVDFADMLGMDDPAAVDIDALWAPRGERAFLRVPIGINDSREPVLLDLKESAELGMGPHGLCVGATGSGKSELLRTLVLALVATHPPEDLAMVLVDYKGGATFAPFADLPHVAGVITNLENQAGLVERVHASLAGEVQRRQRVLKDAGNVADIAHYAALRETRPDLDPLPHLFVVIDEFGELLTAKPDFIDLFLSIGRIGRSIGVHLLLSSQRIEGGKLKGLDTYLSYRLGLRTFSADESRTVLDTTDAFHLPPLPGFGYLKVDTSAYERFKASYVSGPYTGPVRRESEEDTGPAVLPYPAYNTLDQQRSKESGSASEPYSRHRNPGPTVMSVIVDQFKAAAAPVRRIWLPPLPAALPLDAAAGPVEAGGQGMRLAVRPGPMKVPLGLLDDPAKQWQGQWVLDLTLAGGHVAVIGGPQSGKTTLLRTLALSLAMTHTPKDVGIYGLDLVGGGLQALAGLPHVGGIAGRADRERAMRTVEEVRGMLALREDLFREQNIDSVDRLRELRAEGRLPQLPSTDVVLLVDGFGALRDDFEELDDAVVDLLKRGGGYGIHVVAGMLRWNDVRIATQSTFGTRVELRLNDPSDSSIDRKLAETLAPDEPGRVLTDGKLFAQVALPRIDSLSSTTELGPAVEQAARSVRAAWPGDLAQQVRVLPPRVQLSSLPSVTAQPRRVPIGLDQTALAPVLLDLFERDQHLLVLGDSECGKSNLLRLVANGLMARHGEDDLVFAVMDPRRGLRTLVPEEYRGGYAHNSKICGALSAGIAKELEKRMPDDLADQDALADGAWYTGPRIVILVDDYDILTTAGQQPLQPFLPFVPSSADIGLHFVVTRRVAGASRAMYDPFLTTLRESGTSALVMAGDRSEGQLFPGVYAGAQPPGRGLLVRRGEPNRLIQTALADGTAA
ncbi:type VII secretion protein EccC [Streptomyces xinghaiensis]|uniref:Type VII secretion protein EccC n=2 Tax=Streptomyces TaxID=1883 RepID=A0A3M8FEB8_9ACTN|nr:MULTISPECIES: type VII secretion protein EccC [Streptomyces]KNE84029.1 cell division protein FtsK [Streptomyces fradiae]OFA60643.1 type VII secretion protein EccC [Streptomyces fradiae]PQM24714.1 type VII secretion protein EccC [Streptomyces xinghaiensis]RKM98767.1 type VII secretion protein EccC [Streptomyces xinghaiensis]RNC76332.1 type VII secretion protein EccC [Streptomyces xinghaiensis]